MLVKLLSGKSFFIQIILGILFLILFINQFYNGKLSFSGDFVGVTSFLLIIVLSYLFFLTSKLFKSAGLPFWFFIIWIFVFSGIATDSKVSVSLLVCTILFWRMVHAEERSDSKNYAFDVGICLSISSFFYPPSICLIGLILFNYLYMQSLNFRVMLLFILGFILPLAVGLQIVYLTDNMHWLDEIREYFHIDFWSTSDVISLIPVGLLILVTWFDHVSHSGTQDINKRHIYFLFFLYFINWLIILIVFGGKNLNLLAVLGLPVSVFLARYVQYLNSKIGKEIIVWGFLVVMTAFYFRKEIMEIYNDLLGNVAF